MELVQCRAAAECKLLRQKVIAENGHQATADEQKQATLALANALGIFSSDQLKAMDPQLQANVLLGEIVVLLQAIMQQNNTQAGGLSLIDTISALGLGATKKT